MSRVEHSVIATQMGRLLEAARVRADLRQWQLAERAGTSQPGISRIDEAMSRLDVGRGNDVRQDWTGSDSAVSGPGPRRWRLTSGYELRIVVAETLRWSLAVATGHRRLRVVPPARLLADDPDVAGRQRSVASRP